MNKKLKSLARKSALTYKAKDNKLSILEDLQFDAPKTKAFVQLLNDLKLSETKTLFVVNEASKNVVLSSRNLRKSKVVTVDQVNTYDVLHAESLVLSESAVEKIENLLK